MDFEEVKKLPTVNVPTAGRVFYGLGASAAYQAARRGDIPTLRMGGKIIVPVAAVLKQLGIEQGAA